MYITNGPSETETRPDGWYQSLWQHLVKIATKSGFFGPGACGNIYVAESDTVAVTLIANDTFVAATGFSDNLAYNMTNSGSAGKLIALYKGIYLVLYSTSISSNRNVEIHSEVFKNAAGQEQIAWRRTISSVAFGVAFGVGLVSLVKDDELSIRFAADATTPNVIVTVDHGSLVAIRLL